MTSSSVEWWAARDGTAHAQDPASRYPQESLCGHHERSGPVKRQLITSCPECVELAQTRGGDAPPCLGI